MSRNANEGWKAAHPDWLNPKFLTQDKTGISGLRENVISFREVNGRFEIQNETSE